MKINGVEIENTFAEAFPMKAARLIITAINHKWAHHAANSLSGFATSVIGCGCEAGIERELDTRHTPDGRPGISVLIFSTSTKQLAEQVLKRVGQSVMTTVTAACYSGLRTPDRIPLGKSLRFFGDGHQISKLLDGTRYWRVPVMHGEFMCEESASVVKAVGGGNFLIFAKSSGHGLSACEKAIKAIKKIPGVVTPFPGGVVGSGSKVGSKYKFLSASTNHLYCPTLKGKVKNSVLSADVGSVLEVVIDGLDERSVGEAMRVGIRAACVPGPRRGIYRIGAGNYGGKLGPYHFHLHKILK
ncbi:MAG TPA: formylmethanofuran--tetrahydromethanopterin N-formyltransferase [Gammaproteobacteria bacterium]|nr:formylmethanofuran--tetrahydromethanopterin N-formyltransferase [Gammaproteobacteria bacterium]